MADDMVLASGVAIGWGAIGDGDDDGGGGAVVGLGTPGNVDCGDHDTENGLREFRIDLLDGGIAVLTAGGEDNGSGLALSAGNGIDDCGDDDDEEEGGVV
jgi:hypothetical protein